MGSRSRHAIWCNTDQSNGCVDAINAWRATVAPSSILPPFEKMNSDPPEIDPGSTSKARIQFGSDQTCANYGSGFLQVREDR